ncbi:TonB-dependent receptor [Undibacterium seohonense]|uniref:TonB-dependent receptor n=1 Tax=Undibacterium seohonense TaxID=1344950 RepID=A0ABR6X874_9BURK|nr:TonB-dependent receptor [Undibacterium seohonense]MBC3808765.1 TonB-dependent receptor [Undibacterium seohonense]
MIQQCKPLSLGLAIAACFSTPTFAQTDNTQEQVIITAARQAQVAKDVLADNVVITAEQIQRAGATSIVDLLQQQRGIEISRTGGAGSVSSVFIRGAANAQSVVFVDGVRIGSSTTGGATWSSIPLSQIERIEIVYGPLSSLYGADAMGGVIQLFTKKSGPQSRTSLNFGLGSNNLRKFEAGVFGSSANDFQYSLNTAKESTDGFSASKPASGPFTYNADKDGYTQKSFNGNLSWKLNPDLTVGVNFVQSTLDVDFDAGATQRDFGVQKFDNVATFVRGKLAQNWNSSLQFSRNTDRVFTDASYGKSNADTMQRGWTWQNDVSFGKDVLQFVAEKREEDVRTTTAALNGKRDTQSYALAYVMKQDAHLASLSARMDDSSQYGRHNTGSIAYGYKLSDALRVNASYGTSFRAPTFNELYYPYYGIPSNKPELGKNTEVGVFYDDSSLQLSAVYYQNKITDLLVYAEKKDCPTGFNFGCAANINKGTLSGLTMGVSTRLGAWNLRTTMDIQDPTDDTTGKRLARRAQRHASFGVDYRSNDLTVGIESVVSGDRFDDAANKNRLGGYGIVNLVTTYKIASDWSLLARWNNVANKDYELARNYRTPGSNFYLGLSYGYR